MRIVHITTSLNVGGLESMVVDIINEQSQEYAVHLIILNRGINNDLLKRISKRVKIHKINRPRGSVNPYYFLKFNYILGRIHPDIIHCHSAKIVKYIFFKKKKKFCLTIHGMSFSSKNILLKYNRIFAVSDAVKDTLKKHLMIDSVLVYNGIPSNKILPKSSYEYKLFKIVCVGRLNNKEKGQDIIVRALSILKKRNKMNNIRLDFIGDGISFAYLEKLVNSSELKGYVKFLGLKQRDYIFSHLKDYELFVLSSYTEGLPLALAEAMAAKLPVLVSDIDGPMEIIKKGKYGYFFKSEDPYDLAMKIIYIFDNYEEAIKKASEAYQYIRNNFDVKITARKYLNEYKKLYAE